MKRGRTQILVECALLVALATVFRYVSLFEMPQGGSVTISGMAPLVIASLRHGPRWGLSTALVYGILETFQGMKHILYCTTIWSMIGCALLDYVLAYAVMGLACVFAARFRNRLTGACVGAAAAGFLRYLCSFLSGILIWSGYAPEGTPVWIYSLGYNASYMVPEIIITVVVIGVFVKLFEKQFFMQPQY